MSVSCSLFAYYDMFTQTMRMRVYLYIEEDCVQVHRLPQTFMVICIAFIRVIKNIMP